MAADVRSSCSSQASLKEAEQSVYCAVGIYDRNETVQLWEKVEDRGTNQPL